MAPRPLESREGFIARLRAAEATVATQPLGFGQHHFSHVVVVQGGQWQVRRLVLDMAKVEAYRATHSSFMPEHAEMLSEPGPDVVMEADSLGGLIAKFESGRWPL